MCLLKALVLARWYDLSDVQLAEAPDEPTSFRRFCGFSRSEPTPERTAFVRLRRAVEDRGGWTRVVATHVWARSNADVQSKLKAHNGPVHKVRGRIEKIFGAWKRSYGLRQMVHRGLAKTALHVQLTAIAYNLKQGLNLSRARAV